MSDSIKPSANLGVWRLTLLVAGNIIGSGIFLLPSALAQYGTIGVLAWIFTALGALMLALVFAKLGAVLPKEGGFYSYCREAFGDFVGFQVAYNYWIALWVGNAALVVGLTGYLGFFWPALANNAWLSFVMNLSIIWSLTLLNCWNVRYIAVLQMVTTLIKLVPLLLIVFIGFYFINPQHFMTFNLSGEPFHIAFNSAATLTLWSFLGLESASLSANHTINPQRDIPRATIGGVIIAALLYIFGYIAIIGMIPFPQLMHSTAPYADAIGLVLGNAASVWVAGLAAISCLGALTGWILLQGQIPLIAARDNLFPSIFLRENKQKVPVAGLIISSLLMSGLLLLKVDQSLVSQFTFIILLATLASLIPYFFTVMAAFLLFMKYPERFGATAPFKSILMISILAGAYSFWSIIGAGQTVVFYGCLLLLSSMPLYVGLQWKNRGIKKKLRHSMNQER